MASKIVEKGRNNSKLQKRSKLCRTFRGFDYQLEFVSTIFPIFRIIEFVFSDSPTVRIIEFVLSDYLTVRIVESVLSDFRTVRIAEFVSSDSWTVGIVESILSGSLTFRTVVCRTVGRFDDQVSEVCYRLHHFAHLSKLVQRRIVFRRNNSRTLSNGGILENGWSTYWVC